MKARRTVPKELRPRFRVYRGQEIALGPGKIELMEHLKETGSISEAARRMEMSYNHAWELLKEMNDCFTEPLVVAARGGAAGGGAKLTEAGKQVLALYRQMEAESLSATRKTWGRIGDLLKQ
jgi:molybdate transport system regulatory protein